MVMKAALTCECDVPGCEGVPIAHLCADHAPKAERRWRSVDEILDTSRWHRSKETAPLTRAEFAAVREEIERLRAELAAARAERARHAEPSCTACGRPREEHHLGWDDGYPTVHPFECAVAYRSGEPAKVVHTERVTTREPEAHCLACDALYGEGCPEHGLCIGSLHGLRCSYGMRHSGDHEHRTPGGNAIRWPRKG